MAHTRKRASKEKPLSASNEQKSKPSDSSLTVFSVSSGGSGPYEDHLCKVKQETINNGEYRRSDETKIDFSLPVANGNCIITKPETFCNETLEDKSTDLLTERNGHSGLHITVKEEEPGKSQSTKQSETKKSKSYTCVCGKSYSRNSNLNRHLRTHKGHDKTSSIHCDGGPSKMGTPSEKAFQCFCGKSYTISSHLNRHQKTCQAVTKTEPGADISQLKRYVCACGKSYTCSSHLYRHQRSHVDGKKESAGPYICHCGKMFSCRSHLDRHQRTHIKKEQIEKHGGNSVENTETEAPGGIKPYVCHCGKSYTCSSHLYRHQRTHQDGNVSASTRNRADDNKLEKPYKCACGKSYTCTSHLYRHQRNTHKAQELIVDNLEYDSDAQYEEPDVKPYQCECGKSFILLFSLMVHKKIHCKVKLQSLSAS